MPKPLGPRALFVARTAPRPLSPEQRPRDLPSPQKLKAVSKKRLVINIMLKYVKYGLSMLYFSRGIQRLALSHPPRMWPRTGGDNRHWVTKRKRLQKSTKTMTLSMLYHEKKFQDMDTQTVGYSTALIEVLSQC